MRRFLFLQGPHGPFLSALAAALEPAGVSALRVGFNAGDRAMWRRPGFLAFRGRREDWPETLRGMVAAEGVTDLLCYGGSRWMHRDARGAAEEMGLTFHVLEEGYLRPYWITYERGGTNGDSPLMHIGLDRMAAALDATAAPLHEAPDGWGDLRAHIFWGAAYHAALMAGARGWPSFVPHRTPGPGREARLHVERLLDMPARRAGRHMATRRLLKGSAPFHLVMLQLAHDANFRDHSEFDSQEAFLSHVMEAFATGAPPHHKLVLKAHPLEDNRQPLRPLIRALAARYGLGPRAVFIPGGKLGPLLDRARSAVTVNSTSAEQALWRGLPLKAHGRAVYDRPEFVSDQPLGAFFADPRPPDIDAYHVYRRFLLETSQVAGGFYSSAGRRQLLRQLPDLLLAPQDPYTRRFAAAAGSQHIRAVG